MLGCGTDLDPWTRCNCTPIAARLPPCLPDRRHTNQPIEGVTTIVTDKPIRELNVEELEPRIAPDAIGGTPGTGTSNSHGHGTEVSNGATPQPEPGR
jgi:hypothetical protein